MTQLKYLKSNYLNNKSQDMGLFVLTANNNPIHSKEISKIIGLLINSKLLSNIFILGANRFI